MDTELNYKYKDYQDVVKIGHATLDKEIFKSYVGRYGVNIDDDIKSSLGRRLWNCKLIWESDIDCKRFLDDLKTFLDNECEEVNKLYDTIYKLDLLELRFECY